MVMNRADKKRRRKQRLFLKQNGRCCYCGCMMILDSRLATQFPPNYATLEHLDDAYVELPPNAKRRVALACLKCNRERGVQRFLEFGGRSPAEVFAQRRLDAMAKRMETQRCPSQ